MIKDGYYYVKYIGNPNKTVGMYEEGEWYLIGSDVAYYTEELEILSYIGELI